MESLCKHKNIIPYEYRFGKRVFDGKTYENVLDWNANIFNAHLMQVTAFYCIDCQCIFRINNQKDDKE